MSDLLLEIESVADMDLDRAAAIGRAYDVDPELRPRRVGGDPARIKVEGSMEDLIRRTGLPIDWLTVRIAGRLHDFEGGQLRVWPGRGSYSAYDQPDGTRTFRLMPHLLEAGFLRSWIEGESRRVDRIAALFTRLCDAMDASYGAATLLPRRRTLPPVETGLGGVYWLNCFGPAFVDRFPRLAAVDGAQRLRNGALVIRIADDPWTMADDDQRPVREAIGPEAFVSDWGPSTPQGIIVPGVEDHLRFAPGTDEMPWIKGEVERHQAAVAHSQRQRYARARKRRLAATTPADPPAVTRDGEWSTSFDADDWRSFGPRLFRRLGGELAGRVGKALVEEIASAPLNHEESLALNTSEGPIEVRWFIDDTDTVDVYFFGARELPSVIEAVHERWGEG